MTLKKLSRNLMKFPFTQINYFQEEYRNEQFLYQIINANKQSFISYINFDLQNLKLEHYLSIHNNNISEIQLSTLRLGNLTDFDIYNNTVLNQEIYNFNQPLEIISDDFIIVLGGAGYTEKNQIQIILKEGCGKCC
ncbi:unnamed protein product [Paramecium pentaurelia]|uniref:Uncharacterized protein n=1 Tax=Paramecium pentaurelia TaxID=43138 RepID=A0A8S1U0J2_9CILI|nr:unnamed protein product [Paramecium pentaurelia]